MGEVKIREFEFLSSNNYYTIHGKMWIPEGEIKAIVQISHGMAEYIDRYDEFAKYLASNGILAVGNDHMGHGESVNSKDDLGYFSIPIKGMPSKYKDKFTSGALAVKDLYRITRQVKKHYPGIPYILLGHSMGSFLARRYMIDYGDELDGVILVGTGNTSKGHLLMGKALLNAIKLAKGERYRSKLAYDVMYGGYNKRVKEKHSENDWICSDKKVVDKYDNDEKCGYRFTINGLEALVDTVDYVENKKNINKINRSIKTLLLAGEDDPVGGFGQEVKLTYETLNSHGIIDIDMKMYKGMRHEILNETGKENVYKAVLNWIKERF